MDGTLMGSALRQMVSGGLIPRRYAADGKRFERARCAGKSSQQKFHATRGTMQWYSRLLEPRIGLDTPNQARRLWHHGCYRPGAEDFRFESSRQAQAADSSYERPPTTNGDSKDHARAAHNAVNEACYSTHLFDAPKKDAAFWPRLQGSGAFRRTAHLLVDASCPSSSRARDRDRMPARLSRRPDFRDNRRKALGNLRRGGSGLDDLVRLGLGSGSLGRSRTDWSTRSRVPCSRGWGALPEGPRPRPADYDAGDAAEPCGGMISTPS